MKRSTIASIFLNLGYLALALQWVWLLILLLPALFDSSLIVGLNTQQPVTPSSDSQQPGLISFVFAGVAITLALLAGLYAAYKAPGYAKRHVEQSTKSAAKLVLPTVSSHKKLTHKRKIIVSKRLELGIKLLLAVVAFVGLVLPAALTINLLTSDVIFVVGGYLFAWTISWFILEYFTQPN